MLEYIILNSILFLVEDEGIECEEAMSEFYVSGIYMQLVDKESFILYEIYKGEKQVEYLVKECKWMKFDINVDINGNEIL